VEEELLTKMEKKMGINIKYTIAIAQDSWFLPVTKNIVYLSKRLKI